MTWLRTAVADLRGLVVDDGLLATLAVTWLAIIGPAGRTTDSNGSLLAILPFAGLASILVASIVRATRRTAASRTRVSALD